ncbi:MAG: family 43 glycosylhydrolase, partial [Muribaculaceae bacterium]|nr:family 43 glycosylhydrolase [Muribaculaceae bacterium]
MKHSIFKSVIILVAALAVTSCARREAKQYSNPVITQDAPDPSVILADDGKYYLYATGNGYSIFSSDDLVSWERVGTAFTDETWPSAIRNDRRGVLWAPEIRRIGDKYALFYTLWFGDVKYSVIGYAVADSPVGPFEDRGVLIDSQEIGVLQSIDQYYYEEDGKAWIFWGSFRNLYVMELDVTPDAVITPLPDTKRLFAGTAYEGTNIFKRDGWYYFFASTGDYAGGTESTYRTVVARSRDLMGPYLDKDGKDILDNGFTVVLDRNDKFSGPG